MVMEDFVGFTYNGRHSSDLGIYRVSNGNRYEENLASTITDKTMDVPGGDGQYYFGTTFKNRSFKIDFAFEGLKEANIKQIKETFQNDGIHELVFDEMPYKAWSAKVTGTPTFKYVCFEISGERVYKGEGSLTFTCYDPFAHSVLKLWVKDADDGNKIKYMDAYGWKLSNYDEDIYTSKNQWAAASGLDENFMPLKGDVPTTGIYKIKFQTATNVEEGVSCCESMTFQATLDNTANDYTITFRDKQYIKSSTILTWDTKTGLCTRQEGQNGTKTIVPYTGTGILKFAPKTSLLGAYTGTNIDGATKTLTMQYLYY